MRGWSLATCVPRQSLGTREMLNDGAISVSAGTALKEIPDFFAGFSFHGCKQLHISEYPLKGDP